MPSDSARPKRPSTAAMTAKTTAIAVAAAVALTGGLAIQMAAGHDPALAAKATVQTSPQKRQTSSHGSSGSQTSAAPAQVQTSVAPTQVVTRTS